MITIVIETDDQDPSEILDAVHEELTNGFLDAIEPKILDDETSVQIVWGSVVP